jgi:DNA segregation ATPase FtsK/SpoIIIE-like protein
LQDLDGRIDLAGRNKKENTAAEKKGRTSAKKTSSRSRSKSEPAGSAEKRAQIQEEMRRAHASRRIRDVISGLIYMAIGLFIFAGVQFHTAGEFGNQLGIVLKGIFGLIGLVLPWYLVFLGILFVTGKALHFTQRSLWLTVGILLIMCVMNAGRFIVAAQSAGNSIPIDLVQFYNQGVNLTSGGVFGMTIGVLLVKFIGEAGLYILSVVLLLICLLLLLHTPLSALIQRRRLKKEEDRRLQEMMKEEAYQKELERRKREANLNLQEPLSSNTGIIRDPKQESMFERSQKEMEMQPAEEEKKPGILHSIFHSAEAAARREKAKHVKKPSNVVDVMHQHPLTGTKTQELSAEEVRNAQKQQEYGESRMQQRPEPKISFGAFDHSDMEEDEKTGPAGKIDPVTGEILGNAGTASDPTDRFSHRESSGSYGLDPVSSPAEGFGLNENKRGSSGSYGLQPAEKTEAGHGLQREMSPHGDHTVSSSSAESRNPDAKREPADSAAGSASDTENTVTVPAGVHQNEDGEWVSDNMIEETSRRAMNRVLKSADDLMREEQARREQEQTGTSGLSGKASSSNADGIMRPESSTMGKKQAAASAAAAGMAMAGAASRNIQKKTKFHYRKPSLDLLTMPELPSTDGLNQQLRQKARILEETLESFHVDAHVVQVTQGPAVTRYEIQPGPGVKVSKIVGLSDDIALNLRAKSIRIEAPIPGKAAVGIEVENEHIQMVRIREIIGSREFREAKSKISFAVGKDIAGNAIVADLKGMPHLLIAGATGSGKSVCINSIITSILYKASPDEVKLVLIDPKVVELGNYNGIPHLLIPVVTDPGKAAAALNWAVSEMTDRYKKFADENVRDLKTYNEKMKAQDREDEKMPQVVIIIDELADLMMAAPNQVEESICRLAQLARAAGMHLIVATQRPSVDIITGLIKANIPSRIAFAVSSQFDSRTILDMNGAEKLVGKGDMLFNPQGSGKPLRVQGTFISDEEINRVIDFVKAQNPQEEAAYNEKVIQDIEQKSVPGNDDSADELLPDAISCVVHAEKASTSMLQRHFRIGYNRAARIMDEMEERGIVSPQDGSHPRQVLISEDELEQMKNPDAAH